jgi:hypothetical protein
MSAFTSLDICWDLPPSNGDSQIADFTEAWIFPPGPQPSPENNTPALIHQRTSSLPPPASVWYVPIREAGLVRRSTFPTNLNDEFSSLCSDPLATVDATGLGFIPADVWVKTKYTFGELVYCFFQRTTSGNTRFLHKLYNALQIAELDSFYADVIGIEWITEKVMKIHKRKFGELLGIRAIDGSLFHQQGCFPTHGFRELGPEEARWLVPQQALEDVDFDEVRVLVHSTGAFVRGSSAAPYLVPRWQYGKCGK